MPLLTFDIREKHVSPHDLWVSMLFRQEITHITWHKSNNRIFDEVEVNVNVLRL